MIDKKVTVISGGSGNTAIVNALIDLVGIDNITILINQYDNGLSTGVCRDIANVLGPSDARKNHLKVYKKIYENNLNQDILNFFEKRVDIENTEDSINDIYSLLEKLELGEFFMEYFDRFFDRPNVFNYDLSNFSLSNILYAEMYADIGLEETHRIICEKLLHIPDCVVVNSFDNMHLIATSNSGKAILDEGDIVEWCNFDDKINQTYLVGNSIHGLNPKAISAINDCDLLVISTGTFWSSIYPTLQYLDFYKFVNNSKTNKVWFINSEFDKDSYGVTSTEFILYAETLGLDISNITVVENEDANTELCKHSDEYYFEAYFEFEHLGNVKGKNDTSKIRHTLEGYLSDV